MAQVLIRPVLAALVLLSMSTAGCVFGVDINSCDTNGSTCAFKCKPNATIHIEVTGKGKVSGSASCGGVTAACNGTDGCTDFPAERTNASGNGTCAKGSGDKVHCWSRLG